MIQSTIQTSSGGSPTFCGAFCLRRELDGLQLPPGEAGEKVNGHPIEWVFSSVRPCVDRGTMDDSNWTDQFENTALKLLLNKEQ